MKRHAPGIDSPWAVAALTVLLSGFAMAALAWWPAAGATWVVWLLPPVAALAVAGLLRPVLRPALRPVLDQSAAIVADMVDGAISYHSASGLVEANNAAAEAMFGYEPGELIGRDVNALIDDASRAKLDRLEEAEVELLRAGHTPGASGIRLTGVRRDGAQFPIEATISPGGGSADATRVAVVRDVSERRRMEQELKESRSFLHTVVENMPSPVVVYEPTDPVRYVSVNRAFEEMFGVTREFVIGKTNFDLIPPGEAELTDRLVLDVAAGRTNEILGTVQPFSSARGRRYLRATMRLIHDAEERPKYVVVMLDDLTELYSVTRRAQLEEERANERRLEAERANRAKSEFLANMSHELRTPLNAIIGYSEMLEEVARDDDRQDDARDLIRITSAGRHLLELINTILDLSKMESERQEARVDAFDLGDVLTEVHNLTRPVLDRNGNELAIRGESAAALHSDPMMVKQILLNLVDNAAKFTSQGRVEIAYEVDRAHARVRVSDTGVGMTADQLATVFDAFVQGDSSAGREFGGAGLGLTICERLCHLLGGGMEVTSEPGVGTTFVVDLPQLEGAKDHEMRAPDIRSTLLER